MPITEFLDGHSFDPETRRVMGVALEMARAALRLADRTDRLTEILAKRIIALAKEGMVDPNLLCEWALDDLRKQSPRVVKAAFSWRPRGGKAGNDQHRSGKVVRLPSQA
jgi:hypothetical protein